MAVRKLASRSRRRVQGRPVPDRDFAQQWDVVAAFYAATRDGDFERLMEVLDPDVVLRVEGGAGAPKLGVVRGARRVANGAKAAAQFEHQVRLALVQPRSTAVRSDLPSRWRASPSSTGRSWRSTCSWIQSDSRCCSGQPLDRFDCRDQAGVPSSWYLV